MVSHRHNPRVAAVAVERFLTRRLAGPPNIRLKLAALLLKEAVCFL